MKVLQVIPAIAPRYGGPSQQTIGRCRALIDLGAQLLLATTSADGATDLAVEHGRTVEYHGVPARFFRRDVSEAFKLSRQFGAWIDDVVAEFDAVYIDAVFSHLCWSAASACAEHAVPYAVRPLGTLDRYPMAHKPLRKRVAWHLFGARMLRDASAVVYSTEFERRDVESAFGLRHGVVIPNGVDVLQPRTATPAGDPYVAVVCRLDPIKGLEDLIGAFAQAVREPGLAAWRLVIAGDGEPRYVERLRAAAAASGAGPSIRFAGWVSAEARTKLLASAGLFALLSRHENFGISVVEAMQLGVPVLISDQVQICSEVAAAEAGWVVPLESDAMWRTLAGALRDPAERARRGARGAQAARAYAWDSVAPRTLDLLRRIAARECIG